eukprot:TRINITY_DN3254_c0_g2_i6.p1 TRINITY_DN3254_c0_g2~~TRINITY_DN3254_c0_g2_i6.p1  ORF type:complete len:384 (+),score=69.89 TRINITY_DN3254_c0_g2_i6:149-1300(+)
MTKEDSTEIELEEGQEIHHFVDLLRWMYVHKFQSKGADLSVVMLMAHKYKADKALKQCTLELAEDISLHNACVYLDQEVQMRKNLSEDELVGDGFTRLWRDARNYIQRNFHELNLANMSSAEFLDLSVEGVKAVLQSESLHIGTENTVFTAFRLWTHHDFESRKKHAAELLPLLRFPHFYKDFLLDVVKREGELSYPEEAKKVYAQKIIDAYVYHSTSPDRRLALNQEFEKPRNYDEHLLKETFFWKVEDVVSVKETWSEPFFLGGYYLHLLLQRKNPTGPNGGSVGLYMHLKVEAGLGKEFYVPLAFELLVKNQVSGKYVSTKGSYASPFTFQNRAWGYVDILGLPWETFLKETCVYNNKGALEVMAVVWFKDYWEKNKSIL